MATSFSSGPALGDRRRARGAPRGGPLLDAPPERRGAAGRRRDARGEAGWVGRREEARRVRGDGRKGAAVEFRLAAGGPRPRRCGARWRFPRRRASRCSDAYRACPNGGRQRRGAELATTGPICTSRSSTRSTPRSARRRRSRSRRDGRRTWTPRRSERATPRPASCSTRIASRPTWSRRTGTSGSDARAVGARLPSRLQPACAPRARVLGHEALRRSAGRVGRALALVYGPRTLGVYSLKANILEAKGDGRARR